MATRETFQSIAVHLGPASTMQDFREGLDEYRSFASARFVDYVGHGYQRIGFVHEVAFFVDHEAVPGVAAALRRMADALENNVPEEVG